MGRDSDGGAEDVASLVNDIAEMISKYKKISDMPVLRASDKLYDDPRWKAVATLQRLPWFTRAWVIQEVGLAKDPRVLYGGVEFSYLDLTKLAIWSMRCSPNLDPRAGVSFYSVHADVWKTPESPFFVCWKNYSHADDEISSGGTGRTIGVPRIRIPARRSWI